VSEKEAAARGVWAEPEKRIKKKEEKTQEI